MSQASAALNSLYPHLEGSPAPSDGLRLNAALLAAIGEKFTESVQVKQRFFASSGRKLLLVAQLIADSYRHGGRLYVFGNGGSSCDAAHIAVEFQHPVTTGRPALPAQNLAQDVAMITAIANDVGADEIYARQILSLIRSGDVALGISTSGNSRNVLRGLEVAHTCGAVAIGLSGGNGGTLSLAPYVDICLTVESDSIHRVQETHVTIYHVLWDLVHSLLPDHRNPRTQT